MSDEIETYNKFVVVSSSNGVVIMNLPRGPISEEDALNLAAYLVAMTGGMEAFTPVYEAVSNV